MTDSSQMLNKGKNKFKMMREDVGHAGHKAGNYQISLHVLGEEQMQKLERKQWNYTVFFFSCQNQANFTLLCRSTWVTFTSFWEEKATIPLYYTGPGCDFFNEWRQWKWHT